jgi:hypothetical protein
MDRANLLCAQLVQSKHTRDAKASVILAPTVAVPAEHAATWARAAPDHAAEASALDAALPLDAVFHTDVAALAAGPYLARLARVLLWLARRPSLAGPQASSDIGLWIETVRDDAMRLAAAARDFLWPTEAEQRALLLELLGAPARLSDETDSAPPLPAPDAPTALMLVHWCEVDLAAPFPNDDSDDEEEGDDAEQGRAGRGGDADGEENRDDENENEDEAGEDLGVEEAQDDEDDHDGRGARGRERMARDRTARLRARRRHRAQREAAGPAGSPPPLPTRWTSPALLGDSLPRILRHLLATEAARLGTVVVAATSERTEPEDAVLVVHRATPPHVHAHCLREWTVWLGYAALALQPRATRPAQQAVTPSTAAVAAAQAFQQIATEVHAVMASAHRVQITDQGGCAWA